jgi:putative copper export protein
MPVAGVLWRFLHLVAAAYWLGGLIVLTIVAVAATRSLDRAAFRRLMSQVGRVYLAGSLMAWLLLAITGVAMASAHVPSLAALGSTSWGRTLALKTSFAVAAVILTLVHSWAGSRGSGRSIVASRFLSPIILMLTLTIFYLASRLAS